MTTQHWNIDAAHSGVQFAVRHMVISKVRGAFEKWQGAIDFDEQDPSASRVWVRIDAASIDTHEPKRDEHLRSADFLDVEKHPEIAFESRRVEKLKGDRYRVVGDLTIRGVTAEVELDAEYAGSGSDPWGNRRIGFSARTALSRKEFGLTWNQVLETGGVLVGDQIEITLDVQAIAAPAAEKVA
ncbi:MAG TPA: YceI family protein [Kofleriaceae bacterium]|nr:YceI family protein [Kofleriaceae bacterium]